MDERYRHIACFVDESEASQQALAHARRLTRQLGAERLSIAHLVAPPVYFGVYYPPESTAPPTTPDWLADLGATAPEGEVHLVDSFSAYPPAEALRWALDNGVDMIVAASHRGVYRRMLLGSFAAHLAYHAPCPVVLMPPAMTARHPSPAEASGTAP